MRPLTNEDRFMGQLAMSNAIISLDELTAEDKRAGRCECGGKIIIVNSYEICERCGKYNL